MTRAVKELLKEAVRDGKIVDFHVTWTGDDICLLTVHEQGRGATVVHSLAWSAFEAATRIAEADGLYGAGQDLLADAPSGNVRGCGPGVAEIELSFDPESRPVEPFVVLTADKCGPGAYNFPLWAVFTSPLFCSGLMMPKMRKGFRFDVIDMEHTGADRVIRLDAPERHLDLALLLRDDNRFGIQAVWSRGWPGQQAASVSTDRLHTIAGSYIGKDDPVAIVRTQGIFPALEELVSPFTTAHYTGGGARGSHQMPLMPVRLGTAVTGSYCLPIVSCAAYSVSQEGRLSRPVDVFRNPAWDDTRRKAQRKAREMREQGFAGPAMLPMSELEYGAFRETLEELEQEFELTERKECAETARIT
jgi:fructose 1,6-bisphosphate aldolase/phosphatase